MVTRQTTMSTYTRSTPLSCEPFLKCCNLSALILHHRGLFETIALDWWEKSWGGYFTTFNDFLGFGWEVMGTLKPVRTIAYSQSLSIVIRADLILPLDVNKSDCSLG